MKHPDTIQFITMDSGSNETSRSRTRSPDNPDRQADGFARITFANLQVNVHGLTGLHGHSSNGESFGISHMHWALGLEQLPFGCTAVLTS